MATNKPKKRKRAEVVYGSDYQPSRKSRLERPAGFGTCNPDLAKADSIPNLVAGAS